MPAAEKTRSTPAEDAGAAKTKVLVHHLGKVGPKVLLSLPPVKHVYIKLRLLGIRKLLVKLV